ncbi:hypothetical protein NTE_01178 [Candidatus Nitrososphaera evergladensis SR1]|uniref:Uncharacterized protein n=1 Tax=Candidatus Nitrososphaera evergladensis SR1 TaxID=1459636 RepID=A0A075MP01_9ARCH|nr:hypothetical protein [Candidatus Nitrososphaera evergladensis]AIF83251.1 hypothetical protein NTE_01178 [Candidatus Nitrososphaera evergladensis SR1]
MKEETVMEYFAKVKEALDAPSHLYELDINSLFGPPVLRQAEKPKKMIKCPHCNWDFAPDS